MNILITQCNLKSRSGTTIFVRDLSKYLLDRGHHVAVYSPRCGSIADAMQRSGIDVVSDLKNLKRKPDIIHGQHTLLILQALRYLPSVPAVFVGHDFTSGLEEPILHPRILYYVAVDQLVRSRITTALNISNDKVSVIFNSFDESRFHIVRKLPDKPLSCLIYCKHPHVEQIIAPVCHQLGLKVDIAGSGSNKIVHTPENLLPQYDVVFTSAMSAIEALASGASVIVCDGRGAFGIITSANYRYAQSYNFGLKTLQSVLSSNFVADNIKKYNRSDAEKVSALVRQESKWQTKVIDWENIYTQVIQEYQNHPNSRMMSRTQEMQIYIQINTLRVRDKIIVLKRKFNIKAAVVP